MKTVAKKWNFDDEYKIRNKKISYTMIQRYVKSINWGKNAFKERVAPMLSEKNIQDSLSFCNRMVAIGFTEDFVREKS